MTISYRRATAADALAVDRVFRTSFLHTFGHLYRQEDIDAFFGKFTLAAWEGEITDPARVVQLAEADGEPVGYVSIGPLTLPVETAAPALELKQLYLLKEWHGTGAAKALMEWALGQVRARGAEELYLTVYTDNHRARRFYERYGFEVQGPYAFMVGSQADEDLIMRLKL